MFMLTGGEFNLGLIISEFDFLAFNVNLLANIHSLTLLNNLKFLPFFHNDILRSCLKFCNEIPRSYKMTSI